MTLDEPRWRDPNAQPWWDDGGGQEPPGPRSPAHSPQPHSPPPRGPRRTKLLVALGAAVVIVIVLGISLAASRGSSRQAPRVATVLPAPVESTLPLPGQRPSPLPQDTSTPQDSQAQPPAPQDSQSATDDTDPVRVTKAYYGDLAANRPTLAFTLLCSLRQQAMPLSLYAQSYVVDVATGTGIKSFTPTGRQQEQGDQAAVPGTLVLADKESVPITVLLLQEGGGWRVCGSNLGGVLPNPGSGASPDPGTGGVTT